MVVDSQEILPFAVGISLNSLHASALTCLVSSFKEKASLCVWSVTPWQCPPPRCVWCLLPLPPALWSGHTSCSSTPKGYIMKFGTRNWGGRGQWQPHTHFSIQEEHFSLRGVGFFSSRSQPFQGVCGRKPCAPVPLSSGVKLWNCALCQYQLWGFLINNRVKACKLISNINFL